MAAPDTYLEPLSAEYFSLRFPYDKLFVGCIRKLKDRRWNEEAKHWEVHIGHLGEVLRLFNMKPDEIDRKLTRAYTMYRIRNSQTRIRVSNVQAELAGTKLPIEKIDAATSFFVPGHQFMPKFVEGKWDGKRHLFDRRANTFPAGLLGRVRTILDGEGIAYEVSVQEEQPEEKQPPPLRLRKPDVQLRGYQRECVKAALAAQRGVLELATGSGKTTLATYIIYKLKRPALFIVHTRDLLHQTREYMEQHLGVKVGQVGDGKIDIQPVTVATVQTCARATEIKLGQTDSEDEPLERDRTDLGTHAAEIAQMIRTCPVVFFDECHHLPADCCYSLAMQTEGAGYRFGLSATPYRSDRQDLLLEAALGPKIFRANASVLIKKGFLVTPNIVFQPLPPMRALSEKPEYQDIFTDYIVENGQRNRLIAQQARALAADGKSVLILVSQVRHGEMLRELMPDAPLVQGSDAASMRRDIFRKLEQKELLVVIATTLADEGLDIPSLDAVILASGGKSETRALQRLGRALRPAPGKEQAFVFDFLDDAPYLKEHSEQRIGIFQSEPEFRVEVRKS